MSMFGFYSDNKRLNEEDKLLIKQTWNLAIETCLDKVKLSRSTAEYVEEIRKLKK